jgi:hypothetical protein
MEASALVAQSLALQLTRGDKKSPKSAASHLDGKSHSSI